MWFVGMRLEWERGERRRSGGKIRFRRWFGMRMIGKRIRMKGRRMNGE